MIHAPSLGRAARYYPERTALLPPGRAQLFESFTIVSRASPRR